MKQYEAVAQAMRRNGGYATLGDLYRIVPGIEECAWGTKTPFASIRRILQVHSNLFFRIEPGLWALVDEKAHVLRQLGLPLDEARPRPQEFSHSYYQGLVVQLGNLRKHPTHVPPQDRNKQFLSETLGSIASLSQLPPFTYENLMARAKSADVIWLNPRQFPEAFFEIEHTTDIQSSLLRFLDFQDFRAKFFIVSSDARRREYESKLSYSAFSPIRGNVKFLDYESLSLLHSKTMESASIVDQFGL